MIDRQTGISLRFIREFKEDPNVQRELNRDAVRAYLRYVRAKDDAFLRGIGIAPL